MELIVKNIPVLVLNASQVPNVMDNYAVPWYQLGCHNWANDFPYEPDVQMRCNLYKCGDLLAKPHYMSWNPVHSEKPNFHRPQDFDTCIFT